MLYAKRDLEAVVLAYTAESLTTPEAFRKRKELAALRDSIQMLYRGWQTNSGTHQGREELIVCIASFAHEECKLPVRSSLSDRG